MKEKAFKMKRYNIISDWLDRYGDPAIDEKVEKELKKINMEQTAVEWLESELKKQGFLYDLDIEAAKAMFKEQIIKAAQYEPFLGDLPRTEGEHYYEKTFKTKD